MSALHSLQNSEFPVRTNILNNFAIGLHNIRMWIARDGEALIRQFSKQFPAVFVTGVRQVGKTSILTHLFPENTYITLDDPAKAAFAENAPSDFLQFLSPGLKIST